MHAKTFLGRYNFHNLIKCELLYYIRLFLCQFWEQPVNNNYEYLNNGISIHAKNNSIDSNTS